MSAKHLLTTRHAGDILAANSGIKREKGVLVSLTACKLALRLIAYLVAVSMVQPHVIV